MNVQGIEVLVGAHDCLREVVSSVPETAWAVPTPCGE